MIDPIERISTDLVVRSAATPASPDLQAAAERFNRLMAAEPDPQAFSAHHLMNNETPATAFVRAQEEVIHKTFHDVRQFTADAPHMDEHELAARHIALSYQMAMVQVQFNAGVYVAQSGKNGLQTLMKNQ